MDTKKVELPLRPSERRADLHEDLSKGPPATRATTALDKGGSVYSAKSLSIAAFTVAATLIGAMRAQEPAWVTPFAIGLAVAVATGVVAAGFVAKDHWQATAESGERQVVVSRFKRGLLCVPLVAAGIYFTIMHFSPVTRLVLPPALTPSDASLPKESGASKPDGPTVRQVTASPALSPNRDSAPKPESPSTGARDVPRGAQGESISLYRDTPRTLCGQVNLTFRPSSTVRPSPTGWLIYSTDVLSTFPEQALKLDEFVRIGSCEVALRGFDAEGRRFDFEVRQVR